MQTPTKQQAEALLKQHDIAITWQRVAVLQELMSRRDHPRAEQLVQKLCSRGSRMSRAAVYNTLQLFSRQGLLTALHIEGESLRYDIETSEHGHFQCEQCGQVFNFDFSLSEAPPADLPGFEIRQRELTFRGTCAGCAAMARRFSRQQPAADTLQEELT